MSHEYTNRLIDETSPYLLQHAHNPVDWYPWGAEALARAKAENKPILLSIGYSACHWCHVMERESFENPATATLMNGGEFATGHADRTKLHHHIDSIQQLQTGLWRTFQKRMNVLQHLGYLTNAYQLTEVGEWARYIRISPSLLVTELIRTDVLEGMDPPVLAGVMASIAFDDDRPAVFPRISQALAGRLTHVRRLARSLEAYEDPPLLRADVAALPERWTGNITMTWAELCRGTSMAEGDIYRLLARNLEYLSQIRFLSATHPQLAATATQAMQITQREVLEELP